MIYEAERERRAAAARHLEGKSTRRFAIYQATRSELYGCSDDTLNKRDLCTPVRALSLETAARWLSVTVDKVIKPFALFGITHA